jgi:hypothetical protein
MVKALPTAPSCCQKCFQLRGAKSAQPVHDGPRADRRQQFLGILGEQHQRGALGRLFQNLEQAVGGFFHECRAGKDVKGAPRVVGWAVIGRVDHRPHLPHLDQQLRRIGWDDHHVRMGLDEDAGVFFVGVAHILAGGDGLGHAGVQIGGLADAGTVGTSAAEVRQTVGFNRVQAVDRPRQHQRQRVFAGPTRSR